MIHQKMVNFPSKRPSTFAPVLPFKKRQLTDETSVPIDFSLPTRFRANLDKISLISPDSSKNSPPMSNSDTDYHRHYCESDSKSSMIPAHYLPLMYYFCPPFSYPLLQRHLLSTIYGLSSGNTQVDNANDILLPLDEKQTAAISKTIAPKIVTNSASSSKNYVINPATGNKVRRNYKNTTKARRSEANARERTRVHTIGASFDQIRNLVPSLSSDQKMSKLSILRIACKYILLLGAMVGEDYSEGRRAYTVIECIDMLNDTILQESKVVKQRQQ